IDEPGSLDRLSLVLLSFLLYFFSRLFFLDSGLVARRQVEATRKDSIRELLKLTKPAVDPGRLLYKTGHRSIQLNDVVPEAQPSITTLIVGKGRKNTRNLSQYDTVYAGFCRVFG